MSATDSSTSPTDTAREGTRMTRTTIWGGGVGDGGERGDGGAARRGEQTD